MIGAEKLGIEPGDIVRTSYGSGPYVVNAITSPERITWDHYDIQTGDWAIVVRDYDVASIAMQDGAVINWVFRRGDRWFRERHTRYNDNPWDEIYVEHASRTQPPAAAQLGLFVDPGKARRPDRYDLQDDVIYDDPAVPAYHCVGCGLDANLPRRSSGGAMTHPPDCPTCTRPMRRVLVMRLADAPVPVVRR